MAAITIYDMCKAVDRGMVIGDIRLLEKTGGKEDYVRRRTAPQAGRGAGAGPGGRGGGTGRCRRPPSGTVVAVNVSAGQGRAQEARARRRDLRAEHGIEGDAHAGPWHRQVSLLAQESIDKMVAAGPGRRPGRLRREHHHQRHRRGRRCPSAPRCELGEALVEVTQIGKECHTRCAIYYQAGDCVMPREGIFVRVLRGRPGRPRATPVGVRAWGSAG